MEDYLNHTTPHISPSPNTKHFHGYYLVIPIVLVTLVALAMIIYYKRKYQSDELRHRLIPMYTYDPAEQDDNDLDYFSEDEGAKASLRKYGRLFIDSEVEN
ncbi:hypothetical protein NQD34_004390 [Periophthalmus magnuspinnatus]|nr:hypothetical protein NQD34_004390 [Periophthalmus magnuspinnatus]